MGLLKKSYLVLRGDEMAETKEFKDEALIELRGIKFHLTVIAWTLFVIGLCIVLTGC